MDTTKEPQGITPPFESEIQARKDGRFHWLVNDANDNVVGFGTVDTAKEATDSVRKCLRELHNLGFKLG